MPLFHSFPFTYNIKSKVNRAHKALLNLASTTVILPCHSRCMGILEQPASPRRHGLSCRCSFPHAVTSSVSRAGLSSPGQSFPPTDPCPDAVQPLRPSPPARPHWYFHSSSSLRNPLFLSPGFHHAHLCFVSITVFTSNQFICSICLLRGGGS